MLIAVRHLLLLQDAALTSLHNVSQHPGKVARQTRQETLSQSRGENRKARQPAWLLPETRPFRHKNITLHMAMRINGNPGCNNPPEECRSLCL